MNLLQKIIDVLVGPPPVIHDPATAARQVIIDAGFPASIESQALARFDRRTALRQDIGDSLHAVMAWAEAASS